jgi:uncharacterized membrane protein YebE (DUF533 family)
MFDALKILGSLAQSTAAPSAGERFGGAMNQASNSGPFGQAFPGGAAGQGGGGGLGALLGGLMGGNQGGNPAAMGGQGSSLGGLLGGLAQMAQRAAQSPQQEIRNNNPAAVGGLGALAGALLGGGSGAMGGGLMAVLGSLAYSALQGQGGGAQGAAGSPAGGYTSASAAMPATDAEAQRRALLISRAMIQAAKADGQIDDAETQRIMGKLSEHGHDAEARAFVESEMRKPIDLDALVRDVRSPQEAAEIYAASLMAIEVDSQAEHDYLADLAAALNLPPQATAQINSAMGVQV